MLDFEWIWALLLLPLPLIVRRLLPAGEEPGLAISVPLLNRGAHETDVARPASVRRAALLLGLFWVSLLIAASRPYWIGEAVSRTVSGRDLMLAVDISGSMSETDMTIDGRSASRLEVLKLVVGKFIERRQGDRLGLILFGSRAYNYVPLTFDLDTLGELLEDVSTGLAGRHTAIGDAIGIAIKAITESGAGHKVLILVTDGSNTAGFEDPLLAAAAASQQGLTIHTIGVGSDIETLIRIYGRHNIPEGVLLNEPVLRRIAKVSGGSYFRATSTDALERIYLELDRLEPLEHEYRVHQPRTELFFWPLLAGLAILSLLLVSKILHAYRAAPA